MSKRGRYSDADKATALAALDANGGNVLQTSQQLTIPESTLRGWNNDRGVPREIADLREEKKVALADRLEILAFQLVDALPGKIEDAGLREVATALGIVTEKMQLLRGEATDRSEARGSVTLDLSQLTGDQLASLAWSLEDRSTA